MTLSILSQYIQQKTTTFLAAILLNILYASTNHADRNISSSKYLGKTQKLFILNELTYPWLQYFCGRKTEWSVETHILINNLFQKLSSSTKLNKMRLFILNALTYLTSNILWKRKTRMKWKNKKVAKNSSSSQRFEPWTFRLKVDSANQ